VGNGGVVSGSVLSAVCWCGERPETWVQEKLRCAHNLAGESTKASGKPRTQVARVGGVAGGSIERRVLGVGATRAALRLGDGCGRHASSSQCSFSCVCHKYCPIIN
jgi:hypothetical protein